MQTILPIGATIQAPDGSRYKTEAHLGAGGFGAIYLVRKTRQQGGLFALKEVFCFTQRERDRVIFEGEILKRLNHEALPRVYHVFDDEEHTRVYLLMDYIKGADLELLRRQQQEKRIPLSRVLVIMTPIIDAISYMHSQRPPIIHRDIKPSNIIVPAANDGGVLVDFGLAKVYVLEGATTTLRHGTPGYAALEQYGGRTNPRTDIYGLGATLYTLLTGTTPTDAIDRIMPELETDPLKPVHLRVPSVPRTVSEDIQRAMAISSQERFSSVQEFWHTLYAHATQQDPPIESETTAPLAADTGDVTEILPVVTATTAIAERTPISSIEVAPAADSELDPMPSPKSAPVEISQPIQIDTTVSQSRSRKRGIFPLAVALLLIIGLSLVAGLSKSWSWPLPNAVTTPHRVHAVQTPTHAVPTAAAQLCPAGAAVPQAPVPGSPYALLKTCYVGLIHSLRTDHTDLILSNIQQHGPQISGYYAGLGFNGPFTGTIDIHAHLQFTGTIYGGRGSIAFEGNVQLGGRLVGSYVILNQGKSTGETGLWSAEPPDMLKNATATPQG
ncbi:MAG: protein kinase [Ktedonobacteraceae bacterium]|nr:protein kinase [Ktedonobacteraceae bacterium]